MYKRQVVVQRDDGDDPHDDDDEDDDYEDIHGSPLPLRAVYSTIARLALRRSVMRPTKPSQPAREPCAPVPSSTSRAWPSTCLLYTSGSLGGPTDQTSRGMRRERIRLLRDSGKPDAFFSTVFCHSRDLRSAADVFASIRWGEAANRYNTCLLYTSIF